MKLINTNLITEIRHADGQMVIHNAPATVFQFDGPEERELVEKILNELVAMARAEAAKEAE